MLFLIDAGNTNIVFAVYDKDVQKASWRVHTDRARTADEYRALILPLMEREGIKAGDIAQTIISSVVPPTNYALSQFAKACFGKDEQFVDVSGLRDLIDIDIDKPEEVGADRLINALAVICYYQTPAIIIDFGTATTFDVVSTPNHYDGGVIAPGINLSLEALQRAAAKLPMVDIAKTDKVIGKNTRGAMQSGVYWGYISLIEGIVSRIEFERSYYSKTKSFIIATGGLAPLFAGGTDIIDTIDQDLTLKGLLEFSKK